MKKYEIEINLSEIRFLEVLERFAYLRYRWIEIRDNDYIQDSETGKMQGSRPSGSSSKSGGKDDKTVAKTSESGIIEYEKSVKKDVRETFDLVYQQMTEKFGNITTISQVIVLPKGSAYGSYNDNSGELALLFANKNDCLFVHAQKAVQMKKEGKWSSAHPLHTFRHEIGHAIQAEHAKNDPLWCDKVNKIKKIMAELDEPFSDYTGTYSVSQYAMQDPYEFISECIAESMSKKARKTAKQVVKIILGDD